LNVNLSGVPTAETVAVGIGALAAIFDLLRRRRDKTHPLGTRRPKAWLVTPRDARDFVRYGRGPWPRRRRMIGGLIIVPVAIACVAISKGYVDPPAPANQVPLETVVLVGIGYIAMRVVGGFLRMLTWPFRGVAD
jgi:hypothetical protein